MKKTVKQLLSLRSMTYLIAGLLVCMLVAAALALRFHQGLVMLGLLIVGPSAYCLISYVYSKLIQKRMVYVSAVLMDQKLILSEATQVYPIKYTHSHCVYGRLYYSSYALSLSGDFSGALEAIEQLPTPSQIYKDSKDCSLMLLNTRKGNIHKAEECVSRVLEMESRNEKSMTASRRALGAYYVEKGEYGQAAHYLRQAMTGATYPVEKLGINYDLARLEEKTDHVQEALSHYRQAAAIGPKTWMGQEAIRRIEAITTKYTEPSGA